MITGEPGGRRSTQVTVLVFVVIGLLVVLVFPLYYLVLSGSVGSLQDRAAFGEMFGALGAVFSALAFAAVICSIFIQVQDLRHQQKEARDTQRDVRRQHELAAETANVLANTARLDAIAILVAAYHQEVDWLEEDGERQSPGWIKATQRRRWAITEAELLCGLPPEEGLYYEEPTVDRTTTTRPKPHSGRFTFGPGSTTAAAADESE